jgi:hypothetical protein
MPPPFIVEVTDWADKVDTVDAARRARLRPAAIRNALAEIYIVFFSFTCLSRNTADKLQLSGPMLSLGPSVRNMRDSP